MRKQFCFTHHDGNNIYLFTLVNKKGTKVLITNYGAIITSFQVNTGNDNYNDIVLGFDRVEDYVSEKYLGNYPYFGAVIGRYANRIKDGAFKIGNVQYSVAKNKSGDHLHGGWEGFDRKAWHFKEGTDRTLVLNYTSPDSEEGYPGNLEVEIRFELTHDNELVYEFVAHTDKTTIINLTHHSYFNLNNGRGTIASHQAKINADTILEQDNNLVVTGKELNVANTIYDFRSFKTVCQDWIAEDGYDQSFVLNDTVNGSRQAASVYSLESKIKLNIYTTEPLVHFYTGKWIPSVIGKAGEQYGPFSGLCLETQKHPNAINIPHFPNTILIPGDTYYSKTIYKIDVVSNP